MDNKERAPHGKHSRMLLEELADCNGIALMLLHPHSQRFQRPLEQVLASKDFIHLLTK